MKAARFVGADLGRPVKVCAIAGAVIVSLAVIGAQGDRVPAFPMIVSEVAPAGIDRGLRDVDPPRDPRGAAAGRASSAPTPTLSTDVGADLGRPVAIPGEPYVRGSIIVKFRPGTGAEARRAMLGQVNGSTTRALSYTDFDIVAIDPDADPEAAARRLDAQPDVEYAQARYLVHPMFVPNDPLYSRQWSFPTLDMERAWDINPGATSSVLVAVLDSGIAYRSAVAMGKAPPRST